MIESHKRTIEYIVIDVDGTLTDAGIYYDEHGNELKNFLLVMLQVFLQLKHWVLRLLY